MELRGHCLSSKARFWTSQGPLHAYGQTYLMDAVVRPEDIILLVQRVLVILGSASHTITQE